MLGGCFWPSSTSKIQSGNKRVESSLVACLDPGSIPGDSTKKPVNKLFTGFFFLIDNLVDIFSSLAYLNFLMLNDSNSKIILKHLGAIHTYFLSPT